jgi:hypothetical protein
MTCYFPRHNMKRTFALLIVGMVCATIRAGEVKVEATTTTGPEDAATTTFTPNTAKIYVIFKTKGISNGDKIRCVLIADDVGDVAPANTKVLEKTLSLEGDTEDGDFNLSKPTNGWPAGKYHVEIYVNDELATKVKFAVKAASKSKKHSDEEEEESGD